MAVDYLKTYLGIDPDDYSSMEARIRGEEPQAQAPVMMRQPMMMPQQRSLGEMEAMPMAPRPQPTPQVDDRYQSLMDEIASLKAQIEGMQAPTEQVATEQAPVMADEPSMMDEQDVFSSWRNSPEKAAYDAKGMMHTADYRPQNYTDPVTGQVFKLDDRSGTFADWYKKTYGRDLSISSSSPYKNTLPSLSDALKTEPYQAPPEIQNRMVEEPQPIPQAPSQDIQASIDYLAKLPKMNIPQIPDIEQIRQKMEEANMTFPEPVSYQDQLQAIKDLPKITQMPTREEIQTAMQNIPTPIGANVTNPFQKINDILPQSTIDQFKAVASKPNPFMGDSARNIMSQIQQPQMQSFGRPQLPFQGGFMPEMRASGGGIDKAIYDLKFKLNGR
jgi:hypothetical protein